MRAVITCILLMAAFVGFAQDISTIHIPKLEIERNKKEVISGRDSFIVVYIDTLVMKDKSQLVFLGKKGVQLYVHHATIGKRGYIYGTDGRNNGSDFIIDMQFEKLGALYVLCIIYTIIHYIYFKQLFYGEWRGRTPISVATLLFVG